MIKKGKISCLSKIHQNDCGSFIWKFVNPYIIVFPVNIQDPKTQANINKIGIIVNGNELKASLNPSILVDKFCKRDLFDTYFENRLTKASNIRTGIPAL